MRIIVSGVLSLPPFAAGIAWDWLQVATGLRKLGHDVYYVEEVQADWCRDAGGAPATYERSVNRRVFRALMERFGLVGKGCQLYEGGEATTGLSRDELLAVSRDTDLLINMSGHLRSPLVLDHVGVRAYVDQDPVYTQLWKAEYGEDLDLERHDVFFTVGLNIGTAHTPIPDCGIQWHHMLPPLDLDHWTVRFDPAASRFTTIASWTGYDDVAYQGKWYRSKYVEFERFSELPRLANEEFEVALKNFRPEDPGIRRLQEGGWIVSEASRCGTLDGYQEFIAGSRAEIGIAQNAYVQARSGWFSDRAAHYLASGKPVLAQSTGFERHLPTGAGLLSFSTPEEAAAGAREITARYEMHCRAAREFAEEFLDYRKILPGVLDVCASVRT